jgi:catechol 2,3-dioxygenase
MNTSEIDPRSYIGLVALNVSNLERSIQFYESVLGFRLLKTDGHTAALGVETPFLLLSEIPNAIPKPSDSPGLSHIAIVLPTRKDLALSLRHLDNLAYPLQDAVDHGVSEALYLADIDGNGIEIYHDRAKSEWPWHDGKLLGPSIPLNREHLLAELEGEQISWQGFPAGTRIGHIHLQVSNLTRTASFYQDILGFHEMITGIPDALFVAAGNYHHHIAINAWHSKDAPPAPANAVGMRLFIVFLPDNHETQRLAERLQETSYAYIHRSETLIMQDPEGNGLLMTRELPHDLEKVIALANTFTQVHDRATLSSL